MRTSTLSIALVLAVALTGCSLTSKTNRQALAETAIVAGVCDVWSPITYDGKLDTPPTKDQIKRNNAARTAFCQPKGDK